MNKTAEELIDAIDSVTWYNGLADTIIQWKELKPDGNYQCISVPDDYGANLPDAVDYAQLQIIWMICVALFGEYGTSPRYGWIEDVEGFHEFIDKITATQQMDAEIIN